MQLYEKLVELLTIYQKQYELGKPIVSDQVYDALYKQLQVLSVKREGCTGVLETGLTIGYTSEDRPIHKHIKPLLSLEHKFGMNSVIECITKIENFIKCKIGLLIAQPKIDGVSVSIEYENGYLKHAALRGNGYEGENVTAHMISIGIPLSFDLCKQVRGELYLEKRDFELEFSRDFSSARNVVAGSVRLLDVNEFMKRRIKLMIHGFDYPSERYMQCMSYYDMMQKIAGFFPTVPCVKCEDLDECKQYIKSDLSEWPYDTDGWVFKMDDVRLWKVLGYSSQYPRYAFAIKPDAKTFTTPVKSIDWSVGRTGVVTPVLIVEPVNIDGVWVSKASMHNFSEFLRFNAAVGDLAVIIRSGDVIPKILEIAGVGEDKIAYPRYCPSCNYELVVRDKWLICESGMRCPKQLLEAVEYLLKALNIKGLSTEKLRFLYDKGVLVDVWSILEYESWTWLEKEKGWGVKSFRSVKIPRNVTISQFILALGIKGVGRYVSEKIGSYVSTVEELMDFDFSQIDGIGEVIAQNIRDFLGQNRAKMIQNAFKTVQKSCFLSQNNAKFVTVVFTGSFVVSRQAMKEQVKNRCIIADVVSKNVNIVVFGDKPGSKLSKAKKLVEEGCDIRIMDYVTWQAFLVELKGDGWY